MTKVLDHGEVILVDSMADDQRVCGAARVSTGKDPSFTSKGEEADRKLINFLMSNGHGTPFEHAVFQFFVKAPIFVVREWQRHRMASYNEQSGRYSEFEPEFYLPEHVRVPDPKNKQSSVISANEDMYIAYRLGIESASKLSYKLYTDMLLGGVAREMARLILPLNLYTRFWFTVNARSLMNFLELRNHPSAQWEMQMYAMALEKFFQDQMPWTWEAFVLNHRKAP